MDADDAPQGVNFARRNTANIKLASVISDILGWSGRRILKAIVSGESDKRRLAELGHPRLACTREELAAALEGRLRDHHRCLIGQHLKTIEQGQNYRPRRWWLRWWSPNATGICRFTASPGCLPRTLSTSSDRSSRSGWGMLRPNSSRSILGCAN